MVLLQGTLTRRRLLSFRRFYPEAARLRRVLQSEQQLDVRLDD